MLNRINNMGKKRKGASAIAAAHPNRPVEKPAGSREAGTGATGLTKLPVFGILTLAFIAFFPSLPNQYVTWDDPEFIYQNPLVVNVTGANFFATLKEIFSTTTVGAYAPLTITSFAIEKLLFGIDQPFYWHLNNLLLHHWCVYLVFRLCQVMKLSATVCLVAALLFAIHPMRVESVAWLTERKDVLYGVFYLGGMLIYARYLTEGRLAKHLRLVYLFFILSLFSKIQAVAFPMSLLLLDYLLMDKVDRKSIINKLPFFALSLIFGLTGMYLLQSQEILNVETNLNLAERLVLAAHTIVVYIIKSVVPYEMVTIYPYPSAPGAAAYVSIGLVLLMLLGIYKASKANNKLIVFGGLFFLFNVVFVLQILAAGQGFMADRYTYIPYLGLFIIYGMTFDWLERQWPARLQTMRIAGGIYVALLGLITFNQCKIWENGNTLWTHVIDNNKTISTAYVNRAMYHYQAGSYTAALADYAEAIKLEPKNAELYQSRGKMYFDVSGSDQALTEKAFADFNKSIELKKDVPAFYANRAAANGKLGHLDAALDDANKSIAMDPSYADAYYTRYLIYRSQNRLEEALKDGETFLKLGGGGYNLQNDLDNLKRYMQRK